LPADGHGPLPSLGVRLPNSGPFATAADILATADLAERLGYERVWVHDHISWPKDKLTHFATGSIEACGDQDPNFFESVTTVALLAGRLRRAGVGIAGLVLPLRDPRILAKQLATIDQLGGSRLVVALGIGAIRGDFEVMGVPFERRGRISNDYLAAMEAIFGEEQPVSHTGEVLSFAEGTFLPRPAGLRLWVTGSSEPGLRRAAQYADGWMTVYQDLATYGQFAGQLDGYATELGRDPAAIEKGYETYVCVAPTTDEAVAIARHSLEHKFKTLEAGLDVCVVGDPDAFLARLAAYRAAGAGHVELKFIAHDVGQLHDQLAIVAAAAGLTPAPAPSPTAVGR
jgi:alkanesulfonate monooxygenase SsuD/methylene tetrahydromethanopterin reductase-like flavin-dependent oxidoreductase (luciferase family)